MKERDKAPCSQAISRAILATVELSRVGVARCATSSRRLPTNLVEKLQTERVEWSGGDGLVIVQRQAARLESWLY